MPKWSSVWGFFGVHRKDLHKSHHIYSISKPHRTEHKHLTRLGDHLINHSDGLKESLPKCWLPAQLALIYGWTIHRNSAPSSLPLAIPVPIPFPFPAPIPIGYANRIQLNVNTYNCISRWQPSLVVPILFSDLISQGFKCLVFWAGEDLGGGDGDFGRLDVWQTFSGNFCLNGLTFLHV